MPHTPSRGNLVSRLVIDKNRKRDGIKEGSDLSNSNTRETHFVKGGKNSIPVKAIISLFHIYFQNHPRGVGAILINSMDHFLNRNNVIHRGSTTNETSLLSTNQIAQDKMETVG